MSAPEVVNPGRGRGTPLALRLEIAEPTGAVMTVAGQPGTGGVVLQRATADGGHDETWLTPGEGRWLAAALSTVLAAAEGDGIGDPT